MTTKLIEVRRARRGEKDAEVVFVRQGKDRQKYTIYGCKCYESWSQWGAPTEVLGDNVDIVEKWRRGDIL